MKLMTFPGSARVSKLLKQGCEIDGKDPAILVFSKILQAQPGILLYQQMKSWT